MVNESFNMNIVAKVVRACSRHPLWVGAAAVFVLVALWAQFHLAISSPPPDESVSNRKPSFVRFDRFGFRDRAD